MRTKIALTGKARTGKDYIADILCRELFFRRYAFGDELKRTARILFPEHFKDDKKPRWLLQHYGQKMRELDADVWVKAMFRRIEIENPARIVVTDLRQPNEYKELKERGFTVVKVVADDAVRLERMKANGDTFTEADLNHETERHVDSFIADHTIENNGGDISDEIEKILWG